MPDDRTKREKIEAWLAPNSGKTEAEKEIARAQLARMPLDPPKRTTNYEPPTGNAARPTGRTASAFYQAYRDAAVGPDDPIWVDSDDALFSTLSHRMGTMSERMRAFQEEIFSNFSAEEQAAIGRYMERKISKQELLNILHKERPRGT